MSGARQRQPRGGDGGRSRVRGPVSSPGKRTQTQTQTQTGPGRARRSGFSKVEAPDPWQEAADQEAALARLERGEATERDRQLLRDRIEKQVPDARYMKEVTDPDHPAQTVVELVSPGSGDFGIKTLNDKVVGYAINASTIVPGRNAAMTAVMDRFEFTCVGATYKSVTVTHREPAKQVANNLDHPLVAIDEAVKAPFRKGLEQARDEWKDDEPRQKEIRRHLELLDGDFRYQLSVGVAAIHGDDEGDHSADYREALLARMHATEAALSDAPVEGSDDRIGLYDPEQFRAWCARADVLREKIIAAGNYVIAKANGAGGPKDPRHDRKYMVFKHDATLGAPTPTRDVIRDVRKGVLQEANAAPAETFAMVDEYVDHINALDYFKDFKSEEVDRAAARAAEAQKVSDQLAARDPALRASAVAHLLHTDTTGEERPTQDTPSAAVFYERASERKNRVVLSADIRDLGVDLIRQYAHQIHEHGQTDPDRAALAANDELLAFKRSAVAKIVARYDAEFLPRAVAAAEDHGDREVAKDLRDNERQLTYLLGGDEVTLSLHDAFREYDIVPAIIAELQRDDVARARVSIANAHGDAPVDDHKRAMKAADRGTDAVKDKEKTHRKLEYKISLLPRHARAFPSKQLHELRLMSLYADVTPAEDNPSVQLRFGGSGEPWTAKHDDQLAWFEKTLDAALRLGDPDVILETKP